MLLQTNSYIVPKEKRAEHARLMRRFRQVLARLGCDDFEVHEQVGPNWAAGEASPRVVQIMRFRDRKHHAALQAAERTDPAAQQLIAEFCELVNFPYQQQQGFFAIGFYTSLLASASRGKSLEESPAAQGAEGEAPAEAVAPDAQEYAVQEQAMAHEPGHLADQDVPTDDIGAVELGSEEAPPQPMSEDDLLSELGAAELPEAGVEELPEAPEPQEPAPYTKRHK